MAIRFFRNVVKNTNFYFVCKFSYHFTGHLQLEWEHIEKHKPVNNININEINDILKANNREVHLNIGFPHSLS